MKRLLLAIAALLLWSSPAPRRRQRRPAWAAFFVAHSPYRRPQTSCQHRAKPY